MTKHMQVYCVKTIYIIAKDLNPSLHQQNLKLALNFPVQIVPINKFVSDALRTIVDSFYYHA